MSKQYKRALEFATKAHKGQKRKNTNQPYIVHPIAVAERVARLLKPYPGLQELGMVVAILHDVVEDTRFTLKEIADEFGREVAMHLLFLTDPPRYTGSRMERKARVAEKMMVAPALARIVKICDTLDNLRDVGNLDADFQKQYVTEKIELWYALTHFKSEDPVVRKAVKILGNRLDELAVSYKIDIEEEIEKLKV